MHGQAVSHSLRAPFPPTFGSTKTGKAVTLADNEVLVQYLRLRTHEAASHAVSNLLHVPEVPPLAQLSVHHSFGNSKHLKPPPPTTAIALYKACYGLTILYCTERTMCLRAAAGKGGGRGGLALLLSEGPLSQCQRWTPLLQLLRFTCNTHIHTRTHPLYRTRRTQGPANTQLRSALSVFSSVHPRDNTTWRRSRSIYAYIRRSGTKHASKSKLATYISPHPCPLRCVVPIVRQSEDIPAL